MVASKNVGFGYSHFELIFVIVIISLVAAAGLKYYVDVREEALKVGLETQARAFTVAIQAVRAQWILGKHTGVMPTAPHRKLAIDMDGIRIYVNEAGWPANTSTELDSASESQTPAECYELWFDLMTNPLPATVEGVNSFGGDKGEQRYHVSTTNGACRYELVNKMSPDNYFEYNLKTGKVLTNSIQMTD